MGSERRSRGSDLVLRRSTVAHSKFPLLLCGDASWPLFFSVPAISPYGTRRRPRQSSIVSRIAVRCPLPEAFTSPPCWGSDFPAIPHPRCHPNYPAWVPRLPISPSSCIGVLYPALGKASLPPAYPIPSSYLLPRYYLWDPDNLWDSYCSIETSFFSTLATGCPFSTSLLQISLPILSSIPVSLIVKIQAADTYFYSSVSRSNNGSGKLYSQNPTSPRRSESTVINFILQKISITHTPFHL